MGRFSADQVDNYGSSGGSNFFALKNDGDVANVRFMYNNMNDVVGYACHEVTVGDKTKYVNCIREYNEPKSKCPLCAANISQKAKLYIPLYDVDEGEVKIWERGKNFFQKISALCARYTKDGVNLVNHTFDIERHGKPHDTGTTYEIFETGCDDIEIEDLPEIPEILGSIILDKSADEMEKFLETGSFPENNGSSRRSNDNEGVSRRTPSNRRGESY